MVRLRQGLPATVTASAGMVASMRRIGFAAMLMQVVLRSSRPRLALLTST